VTGKGLSRSNLDLSVDPTVNFYRYANGGWMEKNPIPPEYPAWNTFLTFHTTSQERFKDLLQELQQKEQHDDENARKLAVFYTAAMDETKIEGLGIQPLEPVMQTIQAAVAALRNGDIAEYSKLLGTFPAKYGIYPFFNTSASPDAKNASHTLCNLSQGGLGLPDRDYYFDEDKQDKRDAYQKHMALMFTLLEDPSAAEPTEASLQAAEQVIELERKIAHAHMTRTENRDPDSTYNKMTITQLTEGAKEKVEGPVLHFSSYLEGSTGKPPADLGSINVRNVAALQCVGDLAVATGPEIVELYLKWHMITSCAPYLSSTFVQETFNFFEKTLSGTQEMKPRWKRAMAFTEKALGEALGQIYCKRYFDESSKIQALKIVEAVRQALEKRLNEVEWMKSATTREQALKKMSRFHVKIGYPNKWIDYTNLKITEGDDFMTMIFQSRAFEHAREADEMNAPTDREKWVSFALCSRQGLKPFLTRNSFLSL
jgi:putative endopeptidase